MSPAVEDFLSPSSSSSSSTQRSYFRNPNPSFENHPTDSGVFGNGFNLLHSSKLDFNCSNDAAAATAVPVHSLRRKHVKVKKQSSCRDSVSGKAVNGTGNSNTIGFAFNTTSSGSVLNSSLGQTESDRNDRQQSVNGVLDLNKLKFTMGASSNDKLAKSMGSEEVQNSRNELRQSGNLKFDFGTDEMMSPRKHSDTGPNGFGKLNGKDFVFDANMSNGVMNSNSSNVGHENGPCNVALHVDESGSGGTVGRSGMDGSMNVNNLTTEADSHLVNSMSGLKLETRGPVEVGSLVNDSAKAEENNSSDCRKIKNLNFVFSTNRDIQMGLNLQTEELKEKVDKSPNGKLDTEVVFSASDGAGICGNERNDFTSNFASHGLSSNKNGEKADYLNSWHFRTTQNGRKFDDVGHVYGANSHDTTPTEDSGKKDFKMSPAEINFGDSVNRNVDSGIMFPNSKVGGSFQVGNQNRKRSSFKGNRKLDDQIGISKGEGVGDYLKKLDNNIDSVLDGCYSFVFGSNFGNAFGNSPLSKVFDGMKTSNIHDPTKVKATTKINDSDGDSCSNFSNFVFGSDKRNTSCGRSAITSLDQCKGVNIAGFCSGKAGQRTDEVNKVPEFENKEKSDMGTKVYSFSSTEKSTGSDGGMSNGELKSSGIFRKENQPINQNDKSSNGVQYCQNQLKTAPELIKNMFPSSSSSSTTGLGFVPKVHNSEATPTNGAGITNNLNFPSKVDSFGASLTDFNKPDINVTSSFTSDMFPGLSKKLEFSTSNFVGERKLKKTKAKLRKQARRSQQDGPTCLSKEVPQSTEKSPGCSPMDVSPCWNADCAPTSTSPATSQVKYEDTTCTTEKLSATSFSSSSATSFANVDEPVRQRPHQKKYKMKTGRDLEFTTPKSRVDVSRAQESSSFERTKSSDQEICDKWRKRGNQAYKNGELSEAEVCYSKGISSIQHTQTPGFCIEPLLLCYSNRAATRMALGRMREGLKDCRMAAALDPNFVKANLRSANCHLLLGEVEDAFYNYNKCLESVNMVCLDRRIAIDAADGLRKAQKLVDYMKLCAELLQQKTYESATNALGIIANALSISYYSDKLHNMKGEALFVLGKHEEVVQLCEQTLDSAEKNFATEGVAGHINVDGYDCKNSLKLWRWNLMSKSYFHLGRLEKSLDLIEKHEQLRPSADKIEGAEESLISLAVTIRELLRCKNAGNEAFRCGRHTEAVEHYAAAISKSIESCPFAAVCFCNRAAAHQSLGEIIDAIGDCSIAIALDTSYTKALSRRATLQEMIRDYKHAADDLKRLISILETQSCDSSQRSATPGKSTCGSVKDLRRARSRLSSIEEKAKKERSLDLYLILGLKASDASSEVKKAYRKAALRHHPDKAGQILARTESGSDGQKWKVIAESIQMDAERLFKMIGEAYAVLSDSTKRSKYDLEEEMWEDMDVNISSSSSRRKSEFYSSPYETTNRKYYWQESKKSYGFANSRYYY